MAGKYSVLMLILLFLSCQPSVRYNRNARTVQDSEQARTSAPKRLMEFVREWLSTPYQYGGSSKKGIDCSGFVMQLMLQVYHISVPHQAQDQYSNGQQIAKSRLQPGNLVFFTNLNSRGVDHVGVYLGEGKFAHATESAGVVISDLDDEPYFSTYLGACRY